MVLEQQYSTSDIHSEWVENKQNLCTTLNGYHPPKLVWDIMASHAQPIPRSTDANPEDPTEEDGESSEEEEEQVQEEEEEELTPLQPEPPRDTEQVIIEQVEIEEMADFGGD